MERIGNTEVTEVQVVVRSSKVAICPVCNPTKTPATLSAGVEALQNGWMDGGTDEWMDGRKFAIGKSIFAIILHGIVAFQKCAFVTQVICL